MLTRIFSANTSQIFLTDIGHDYFQSTSTRFLQSTSIRVFLSKYAENICQLMSVETIFQPTSAKAILQTMLGRFFVRHWSKLFFSQLQLGIFQPMLTNDVFWLTSGRFYLPASTKLFFSQYWVNIFVNACKDFLGRRWLKTTLVNVVRKDPNRCQLNKFQPTLVRKPSQHRLKNRLNQRQPKNIG